MTHETADQRRRRHKRDRLRGAQLAPYQAPLRVFCVDCGHARLLHDPDRCIFLDCTCAEYVEET